MEKVRIDKWLWAARFFKTRSLAKRAIEGGKVQLDRQRIKASKEICIGMVLNIRQGWDEKTVTIIALSEKRGNASIAQTLFEESAESMKAREAKALERKSMGAFHSISNTKPTKKQRRQIHQFKNIHSEQQPD